MAADPILDPTTIDLSVEFLSKEEVLRLNAQRDEFEQLDKLVSFDEEEALAVGVKAQREDDFWTKGHIPGRPLMPGVLMIEMAAQISSLIYHLKFDPEGENEIPAHQRRSAALRPQGGPERNDQPRR